MVGVLIYLKEKMIIHRDLNLSNFMLTKQNDLSDIQVIDFGLSKDLSNNQTIKNVSGTPYYIAPENLLDP
jgi:serine/threonine protein kinase